MQDCAELTPVFEVFPLRFHFVAQEAIRFPAGKPANVLRGGFGLTFRRLVCIPECPGAETCTLRSSCAYARAFEPRTGANGPSGLADAPRPFVFRARHLDSVLLNPGQPFHFDFHLFDVEQPPFAQLIEVFAELGREGMGPRRGKADLVGAYVLDAAGCPRAPLLVSGDATRELALSPVVLPLRPATNSLSRITVHFVTPTELKTAGGLASRPDFPILFSRIRDRISTLKAIYGRGPLKIDFQAMAKRAESVVMVHSDLRHIRIERCSSRTGQAHPLGGFTGTVEYEGELAEFLPYLQAARWTGVGRQTVWGKGEIAVPA
ncbi:MAG: CRISPR system precrRNA processing endoribonuclease RAMP protein Cas6 [Bryobacterales bacterium]|nr:CRISPR system precrRNA processing endoribonuclease RAMP protein Cas6 [Bryobacterales bacterium]